MGVNVIQDPVYFNTELGFYQKDSSGNCYTICLKDGKVSQEPVQKSIAEIKKGNWYRCIKTNIPFIAGRIYFSDIDSKLLDSENQSYLIAECNYPCFVESTDENEWTSCSGNKVKHKFKVGDKVTKRTWPKELVHQIFQVTDDGYNAALLTPGNKIPSDGIIEILFEDEDLWDLETDTENNVIGNKEEGSISITGLTREQYDLILNLIKSWKSCVG